MIDLSFTKALPIITSDAEQIEFILIGTGGTGSWLAPNVARLMRELDGQGRKTSALFIDPDVVESGNVPRQNFCDAEVGLPKAKVLAARYSLTWGVNIAAIVGRFDPNLLDQYHGYGKVIILIGCVDNALARQSIAAALERNPRGRPPFIWWLDTGNTANSGQVLLGSATREEDLKLAWSMGKMCVALPSPAMQHPELLEPLAEELTDNNLSCAELMARNAQSLMINQRVAAEAGDYLLRLTLTRDLRRFATYFDLASGSARSRFVLPEVVDNVMASCGSSNGK